IVRQGTESGIDYVDVRFCGSNASTFNLGISSEGFTNIPATYGQTWTGSLFAKLVGGTTANTTIAANGILISPRTGAGALLTGAPLLPFLPTTGALGVNRVQQSFTPTDPTTGNIVIIYQIQYVGGSVPIDITVRLGWPQLELNPTITSSVTSATVNAGGSGFT